MGRRAEAVTEAPIGIAGAGRVGQALARLLRLRGAPVVAIASRTLPLAREAAAFAGGGVSAVSYEELPALATRLLIAVPDDAIEPVASLLAENATRPGLALHTCGARGPEALRALAERGFSCATLHPLQTVATPEQGVAALPGVAFAIAGSGPAAAWAEELAALLRGTALHIAEQARPVYHAAAVMASNYLVALLDASVALMGAAGVDSPTALAALAPLARASIENTLGNEPAAALTGPIERGDAGTVAAHLAALARLPAPLLDFYRAAGLYTLEVARRRGLSPEAALEVERWLKP